HLLSPNSTAETSKAKPRTCTIVGTGQRVSRMNDARSVPAMLPRVEKAYRAPATLPMVATVRVRRRIANGDTMPITAAGKKNRAAEAASGPARAPNCTADRDD